MDRIVHRSITSVLDAIFYPLFIPVSFWFRNWMNTHTLFLDLQGWKGVKRFVHADIRHCFDRVPHSLLLDLLREHINDERFINLIHQVDTLGSLGHRFNSTMQNRNLYLFIR